MNYPQVIFFDAVGTLFGVKGGVGQVYADMAQQYGVSVAPEILNQAFGQAFRDAGNPAFPGVAPSQRSTHEYDWWRHVAIATFQQAGVISQFNHFDAFFEALFRHFATATPWYLYDDTLPTLAQLRSYGIALGVVSNFDSRLHQVLSELALAKYFTSITISTEVGAAKPDPLIFERALAKHGYPAAQAWHIGDSLEEDYRAATAAGLTGIWLKR